MKIITNFMLILIFFLSFQGISFSKKKNKNKVIIDSQITDPTKDYRLVPRHFKASQNSSREITLTWSIPFNNPDHYIIERSKILNGPFKEIKKTSSMKGIYKDKGKSKNRFKDNQIYFYQMYSITKKQKSKKTNIISGKTAPKPFPPSNLQAVPNSSREILLTWDPPKTGIKLSYIIERRPAMKLIPFKNVGEVEDKTFFLDSYKNDHPIIDSTEYLYQVKSINKVKSISITSPLVLVKSLDPAKAIKNFHAISNQIRSITLKWDKSINSDIEFYIIEKSSFEKGPFHELVKLSHKNDSKYIDGKKTPGTLADNKTFYYKIYSINKAGSVSVPSNIISATTKQKPPIVKNVQASSKEPRQITLTWDLSTDLQVKGYQIFKANKQNEYEKIDTLKGIDRNSYTDKGEKSRKSNSLGSLSDSREYKYKIYAYNQASVISNFAEEIKGFTKNRPLSPYNIQHIYDNKLKILTLSWPKDENIRKYIIESSKGKKNGKFHVKGTVLVKNKKKSMIFKDKKITYNKICYYRIQAIDNDGLESKYSSLISIDISISKKIK